LQFAVVATLAQATGSVAGPGRHLVLASNQWFTEW
jgi:hypothetical protein